MCRLISETAIGTRTDRLYQDLYWQIVKVMIMLLLRCFAAKPELRRYGQIYQNLTLSEYLLFKMSILTSAQFIVSVKLGY